MSKRLMMTFSRKADGYPSLWAILTEKEMGSSLPDQLTPEILKKIVEMAGMKWEYWTEGMIHSLIMDPESQEPMELLNAVDVEEVNPMTETELERALDEIEYLDKQRMSEGREWDFTPMGP